MKHAFREQDTPNADSSRTHENTHFGPQSVAEGLAAFNAALPKKHRKDAVQCIEYLFTASPDALNGKSRVDQDRYFADALDWLRGRHGDDNVVYAGIHRDETTPHMYAYVVPYDPDTGNLNARRWLGGATALGKMQTDFAERVGKPHGFRRGVEHSRAQHTTIREFYGALAKPEHEQRRLNADHIERQVIEKKMFSTVLESSEAVATRVTQIVQAHYAPAIREASAARLDRRKAKEAMQTNLVKVRELESSQKCVNGWENSFGGLPPNDLKDLVEQAARMREAFQRDQEKQRRVTQLADLIRRGAGAVLTFAQHAVDAIKAKAGEWRKVDWATVEDAAIREAVRVNQQTRVAAWSAVLKHSPGQAGLHSNAQSMVLEKAAADDVRDGRLKVVPREPAPRDPSMGR